jgi:hypothetical protein
MQSQRCEGARNAFDTGTLSREPCHGDLVTGILSQGPSRDLVTGTLAWGRCHRDLVIGFELFSYAARVHKCLLDSHSQGLCAVSREASFTRPCKPPRTGSLQGALPGFLRGSSHGPLQRPSVRGGPLLEPLTAPRAAGGWASDALPSYGPLQGLWAARPSHGASCKRPLGGPSQDAFWTAPRKARVLARPHVELAFPRRGRAGGSKSRSEQREGRRRLGKFPVRVARAITQLLDES